MVLYKRSGRFCPRISTLIIGFIQEIRGRWRWEAPSDCAVAQYETFKFSLYRAFICICKISSETSLDHRRNRYPLALWTVLSLRSLDVG